jgi:hypothetical protein
VHARGKQHGSAAADHPAAEAGGRCATRYRFSGDGLVKQPEAGIAEKHGDRCPEAGAEVVQACHGMAIGKQSFAQKAAEKACAVGDQSSFQWLVARPIRFCAGS